jgi:hypothetical protein
MNMNTTALVKRHLIIALALMLTVCVSLAYVYVAPADSPVFNGSNVYAIGENWEDCDLNGYDDTTDHPVPWAGFDCTRGDTVPADWDGVSNSYTKPAGAGYTPPASTDTGSGASTTDKSTDSKTTDSKTTTSKDTKKSTDKKADTKSTDNSTTTKSTTDKNTKQTDVDESSDDADALDTGEDVEPTDEATEETTDALEEDVVDDEELTEEDIISTKGEVEIVEAGSSVIHAGSQVTITGSGFAGSVEDLTVEIHSTPQVLDTVASDADGFFQLTVSIPDDLEAGIHHIIVLYQGQQIISQEIEIAAPAATGFFEAFVAGFTTDNNELLAGLGILGGLIVLSGLALLIHALTGSLRRKRIAQDAIA